MDALQHKPLSVLTKKPISRQTIQKYFREGSDTEKVKGVSKLSFRIISYVLWSIDPGSEEEYILDELVRPVANIDNPMIYLKREALKTDALLPLAEESDPIGCIPQELPPLTFGL